MYRIKKLIITLSFMATALSYQPAHGQMMMEPLEQNTEAQETDIGVIIELLATDTIAADQEILGHIFNRLQETTEEELVNELAQDLTIDELRKLYKILAEAPDFDWTEDIAEKVWQARSHKIKIESPVMYSNPRIVMIAAVPGERQFLMLLSDGTAWDVAEHLSDIPELNATVINGLLGQYTEMIPSNEFTNYSYRITALGFPEIQFNGYLLANQVPYIVHEDQNQYWLWD